MGIAKFLKKFAGADTIPQPVVEKQTTDEETLLKYKELLKEKKEEIEQEEKEIDKKLEKPFESQEPQSQAQIKEAKMDPKESKESIEKKAMETEEEAKKATSEEAEMPKENSEEPDTEEKPEEKQEEKPEIPTFSMRFIKGSTFENSYIVADDGTKFSARKISRIIPKDIQKKIISSIAETGNPPADIVTPDEILSQLSEQGVDSVEKFDTAMNELEAQAKKAEASIEKKAGMMAWNEAEIPPAKLGKPSDGPIYSVMADEVKAGQKLHQLPKGQPSKVRDYYGRLPGAAGGDVTTSLNPQAALLEKVEFLRKALEEAKLEAEDAKNKAKMAEETSNKLMQEKAESENVAVIESLIKELKGKNLLSEEDEDAAIRALSKLDKKSLSGVAALIKLIGKKAGMGMQESSKPSAEEKSPKLSAASHIPPSFMKEDEPTIATAPSYLAKYWDAK